MEVISNIIWVDSNVDNEENSKYQKELESIWYIKLKCFKNIKDSINYIKQIKFVETKIIISGRLYIEFIDTFIKNINNINVIPKIIIFTKNKDNIINNKSFIL